MKTKYALLSIILMSFSVLADGNKIESAPLPSMDIPEITSDADGKSVEGIWIAIQKIDNVLERMSDGKSKDSLKESRDKIYQNLTSIIDYEGVDPYPCDTEAYKSENLLKRYEDVSTRYKIASGDNDYKQIKKDRDLIKSSCEKSFGSLDGAIKEYIKNNQ